MGLFSNLFKKKLLSDEDNHLIVKAIRKAEMTTSGEVRVFVENRCSWMDAMDRAAEIFFGLKMDRTDERNGVLVYVALKDRQVAVFGDEGIHRKVGTEYWQRAVKEMIGQFHEQHYGQGIAACVIKVGEALTTHFPYDRDTDRNELSDEIVFGK